MLPELLTILWATATPAVPADVKPMSPAACRERIAGLESHFRAADHRPDRSALLPTSEGFDPPRQGGGGSPHELNAIVELGLTQLRVDGRSVERQAGGGAAAANIAREIEVSQRQWRLLHANKNPPRARVGLWIDRRVRAREAVKVVKALGGSYDLHVLALDESSAQRDQVFPAHVGERLRAIRSTTDPERKSQLISQATSAAMRACAGRDHVVGARDSGDQKQVQAAIIAALMACSCAADIDLLEALALGDVDSPQVNARPVLLRNQAKAILKLTDAATMQDFIASMPVVPFTVRWTDEAATRHTVPSRRE